MKMYYLVLNFDKMNFAWINVRDGDMAIKHNKVDTKIILIQFPGESFSYSNHSILNI